MEILFQSTPVRKIPKTVKPPEPPKPEPPKPEPVPEAMDLMNMGPSRAATTQQSDHRSYKDIMDQMRRAAQSDESAFYKGR